MSFQGCEGVLAARAIGQQAADPRGDLGVGQFRFQFRDARRLPGVGLGELLPALEGVQQSVKPAADAVSAAGRGGLPRGQLLQ